MVALQVGDLAASARSQVDLKLVHNGSNKRSPPLRPARRSNPNSGPMTRVETKITISMISQVYASCERSQGTKGLPET